MLQQQYPFAGKVDEAAAKRRLRLFTDRISGKLTILLDGVNLGLFGAKGSNGIPRNLGANITHIPQPGLPCTFSNFWIGPWNGRLPAPSAPSDAASPDSVLLSNGDETHGLVRAISAEVIKLDCDAGQIELPTPRVAVVDLGGAPDANSAATRLRFTGLGVVTVKSYGIADGVVTFETDLGGPVKLPIADLRELDFASGFGKAPEKLALPPPEQ